MNLKSLEQERAKFAYEKVKEVREENKDDKKTQGRYRSYVKSAPVLILTNGLGQALAFYVSKVGRNMDDIDYQSLDTEKIEQGDKRAYAYLYKHISEWLAKRITKGKDPLEHYMESDSITAIEMAGETLALLNWLKRFADAMLEEDSGEGQ